MRAGHRVGLGAAVAALFVGAACSSNRSQPMDASLKEDLAAATTANTATVSISPLELGQRVAPAGAKRAPQPVKHVSHRAPAMRNAAAQQQPPAAAEPQPQPRQAEPQPQTAQPAPTPSRSATRPAPVRGDEDGHHGRYKTEAEIFQQMPWIRP